MTQCPMNDFPKIFWLHGLKHSSYVDSASNGDFSVETVMRQNADGSVTILECSILPKIVTKDKTEDEQA